MEATGRPRPGRELLGVATACQVADGDRHALLRVAAAALRSAEHGTHVDVVCTALARAGGGPAETLAEAYRTPVLGATIHVDAPVREILATLGPDDVDLAAVAAAVVRFESCRHLGLVWAAARRLAPRYDVPVCQMISDGWHGLLLALHRYEAGRWEFSTYAMHRITGAIRDGLRADSPVPKRLTTLARAAIRAEDDLTARLNRHPTRQEFVSELGDLGRYAPLLPRLAPPGPLEPQDAFADRGRAARALVDMGTAESCALERLRRRDIVLALSALPAPQRSAVQALLASSSWSPGHRTRRDEKTVPDAAAAGLAALRDDPLLAGWQ